ncbi:MAG TPA: hypothetical protein VFK37_08620, partial [Bacillales bacterium]|nr:hypothetical protein [Bacillales bacterium]
MKWVTFLHNGAQKPGILTEEGQIVDLEQAELKKTGEKTIPSDVLGCIEAGEDLLDKVKQVVEWAKEKGE